MLRLFKTVLSLANLIIINKYILMINKLYPLVLTLILLLLFSHSFLSDSLQPHELQHARLPYLSPTPRACSNSCPLSQWWHPTSLLILCCLLLVLRSIFRSIRVFYNELVLHIRWPKYWSFNFSFSPSNEYSGLISFRMDWLDLLVVQGTLKSLLHTTIQNHQFFNAQLSSWSNSNIHTWLLEIP